MELLDKWVFDEVRPVTVAYVTRHSDFNASEASKLLQEFADRQKGKKADVSVTYLLSGEVPPLGTVHASKSAQRTKVTVCKADELEKCKSEFTSVISCSIYSVQAAPVKSLQTVFEVDWMDEEIFPKKPLVQNKQSVGNLEQWKQGHPVGAATTKVSTQKKASAKPLAVKSTFPQRSQTNTISAMFAGTAKKDKHETPTKSKRRAEATPEKKSGGPSSAKQRRGGIYLSSDEDEAETKPSPAKKDRMPKAESMDLMDEHDDIFCTAEDDSFEEPMEVEPREKTPQKKQKAAKTTSVPVKSSASTKTEKNEEDAEKAATSSPPEPQTRRAYRKETVTENFVDEEGYLVTREVPKVVEVDETAIPQKPSQSKPILTAANKTKTEKKGPPKGQSKISSFFSSAKKQ